MLTVLSDTLDRSMGDRGPSGDFGEAPGGLGMIVACENNSVLGVAQYDFVLDSWQEVIAMSDLGKSSRELRSELRKAIGILSAAKSVGNMGAESAAKEVVLDLKRKLAEREVEEFMRSVGDASSKDVSKRK